MYISNNLSKETGKDTHMKLLENTDLYKKIKLLSMNSFFQVHEKVVKQK